jgi:hypothetical protein
VTDQHYGPTDTEQQKARLGTLLPGWSVWPTMIQSSGTRDWSAMPDGARTAAVTAHSPDELVDAVKMLSLDGYIGKLEADLAATPDDWLSKREMLTANLQAARKLREG